MTRLFRRAGRVEVRADGTVYKRRGVVFAAARGAEETAPDLRHCGSVPSPLYRYFGDAAELLAGGEATVQTAQGLYTVLECAPVAGVRGRVYVEAVLEERREAHDGQ